MVDLLWHARVFMGEQASGCSVGVVIGPRDPVLLAEALEFDQTIVVAPLPREGAWAATASSAIGGASSEPPLAGLLAAGAVLRGATGAIGSIRFETAQGPLLVTPEPTGPWSVRPATPSRWGPFERPAAPLASVLGRDPAGRFPERVLPGPRRRYYRRVATRAALELLTLSPDQAWSYLRHEGLSDVCLYAGEPEAIALRVFGRRATGREVRAAPEAALGLLACLEAEGCSPASVEVEQGSGPARQRSRLELRADPAPTLTGAVTLLGRGELVCDLGSVERVA